MMIRTIVILGCAANHTLVNAMARKVVPHSWWYNHRHGNDNHDDVDNHDDDDEDSDTDLLYDHHQGNTVVVFRCINVDAVFPLLIASVDFGDYAGFGDDFILVLMYLVMILILKK